MSAPLHRRAAVVVLVAACLSLLNVYAQGVPAPVNLTGSATSNVVTLTWSGPGNATFVVEAGSAPGLSNLATARVAASPVTFAGVPPGTYYVRVRAENAAGQSAPSNEIVLNVGVPGGAPGVPTRLVASSPEPGRVVVTWAAPTTGGTPSDYLLEAGTSEGAVNIGTFPVGPGFALTATNVPLGTYYLRLRARNALGVSAPTADVLVTVGAGQTLQCGDAPGPGNRVIPLLASPFRGRFRLWNHFDHDLPIQFGHVNGYVVNHCGQRVNQSLDGHAGHDFEMPVGTPLYATAAGRIVLAGESAPFYCPVVPGGVATGLYVEIRHPAVNGEVFLSSYAHLSEVRVVVGQDVTQGQLIGLSGNTGCSTGPHLHLQIFRLTNTNSGGAVRVDPYGWEAPGPDPWALHPQGASSFWLWLPGEAPPLR
jgi:murein DD-endopeptidase MepM/ murein hydrolase activator NlpD